MRLTFKSFQVRQITLHHMSGPHAVRDSLVPQIVESLSAMQETWVRSLGQEDPLERKMATHSSILAWKISWPGESSGLYSPQGHKESDTTERLHSLMQSVEGLYRTNTDFHRRRDLTADCHWTQTTVLSWVSILPTYSVEFWLSPPWSSSFLKSDFSLSLPLLSWCFCFPGELRYTYS